MQHIEICNIKNGLFLSLCLTLKCNAFKYFVLDGPDTVVLDPYQDVINITEGDTLGPLDCTTDCYPPCNIIWKTNAKGDFTVFRKFLNIPNIMRNQTGTFTCKVSHTADTTRRKSKDVIVNVHCEFYFL